MNKLYTLSKILLLSFPISLFAQTAIGILDANNTKAFVYNNGCFFNDGKYQVPKPVSGQPIKSTIYTAGHWIGGLSNGQVYLAAETYRQTGKDFQQGPVSLNYTPASLAYWNRLWKISKSDIDSFRSLLSNGQSVSQFTDILQWPAKGNILFGDSTSNYAPFMDLNGNGLYEPLAGEYPQIKGDKALYTIINDDIIHGESGGQKLQLEIHRLVYAFNAPNNKALNNTTFVDLKLINKSTRNYDSLLFASWVDFDLGDYADDYVGTDTARNMIYTYNGKANDSTALGYGTTPPAQACVLINHKLWSTMYYNNTPDPITGNPVTPLDHLSYMNGRWRDGSVKTASGIGAGTSGLPTRFSFSGDPCLGTGWWEGGEGIAPNDRRIMATANPAALLVGGQLNYTLAFVYSRADSGDNIASFCTLKTDVDSVVSWYKNQKYYYSSTPEILTSYVQFSLYPNPSHQAVTIYTGNTEPTVATIMDLTGREIGRQQFTYETSVDVSELNKGIYFVQLQNKTGKAIQKLLVD